MAERNPEVVEMVGRELDRDPEVSVQALFEQAQKIDPAVGELSLRQFHARYPLPIKRSRSQGKRRTSRKRSPPTRSTSSAKRKKPASGAPRDEVRKVFLDFAGELARAESRASIVEVLSRVDEFVDRALASSGSGDAR